MDSDTAMACPRQRGFVLALTLWILAAIAVVVGLVTLWALDAVRDATQAREQLDGQLAIISTRDTLMYLGATRERTLAGMQTQVQPEAERALRSLDEFGALRHGARGGELRLDGQPYQGLAGASFAIQDEAGLFSLVAPTPFELDRFLAWAQVPPGEVAALRDAFLDYGDADSLRLLNGAEEREYARVDRPPPPNRRLLLPRETTQVLGWERLSAEARERLPGATTTFYSGAVNLNTVPEDLLPVWVAGCPQACRTLVERRELQPFRAARDVESLLGITLPGDEMVDYRFLADDTLRFTLWSRSGLGWRIHVRFTPLADQVGPWSILAAYPISAPGNDAPAQPTGSDLLADTAPGRS